MKEQSGDRGEVVIGGRGGGGRRGEGRGKRGRGRGEGGRGEGGGGGERRGGQQGEKEELGGGGNIKCDKDIWSHEPPAHDPLVHLTGYCTEFQSTWQRCKRQWLHQSHWQPLHRLNCTMYIQLASHLLCQLLRVGQDLGRRKNRSTP